MELSRLHDKSTVHRKLSQLKIITQIENFKLNEGESKKERVANPLQSKRKTLSSMRKLPKTLLPSGRPYACCACDGFVDYDRANITADILYIKLMFSHAVSHIRQYLGDYYKNHSVTLQSKRRKYLHDIWTVELAA